MVAAVVDVEGLFEIDDIEVLMNVIDDLLRDMDYKAFMKLLKNKEMYHRLNTKAMNNKFEVNENGYKFMRRHDNVGFERYYYKPIKREYQMIVNWMVDEWSKILVRYVSVNVFIDES